MMIRCDDDGLPRFSPFLMSFLPVSFPDQLQEIRKVTLASVICANMEEIFSVQPEVFIQSDPYL